MRIGKGLYTANEIASYIIYRNLEVGRKISNLQLQKILYYVQAAFLINFKRAAFNEDIIAWKYGPVVDEVYQEYKCNSNKPIKDFIPYNGLIADKDIEELNRVIDAKSNFSAFELVDQTHEESPWRDTNIDDIISLKKIFDYFDDMENKKRIWDSKKEAV